MQVTITSYLDYQSANLLEQINLIKELKLKTIPLRFIDGKSLLECDVNVIEQLVTFLKEEKVKVCSFDPDLSGYSIYQPAEIAKFKENWTTALNLALTLKSEAIYYQIPIFDDVINELSIIKELIYDDCLKAKQKKIKVVLKFNQHYKTNTYFYLITHLKDLNLSVEFDPAFIYQNKESLTATYRIFRNHFGYLRCEDIDKDGLGRLIGYGELEWMIFFKKLFKQNYKGYLILDLKLIDNILGVKEKTSRFQKLRKAYRKKLKIQYDLITRIGSEEAGEIIKQQLQVLNLVFYNKKD